MSWLSVVGLKLQPGPAHGSVRLGFPSTQRCEQLALFPTGLMTGKCVRFNSSVKTCEIFGWCPVEVDDLVPRSGLKLLPLFPLRSLPSCTSSTCCRAEQAGAPRVAARAACANVSQCPQGFVPLLRWFAPNLAGSSPHLCWVLCARTSSPCLSCLPSEESCALRGRCPPVPPSTGHCVAPAGRCKVLFFPASPPRSRGPGTATGSPRSPGKHTGP